MEGRDDLSRPERPIPHDPEICFTPEQLAIRALVDRMGQRETTQDAPHGAFLLVDDTLCI